MVLSFIVPPFHSNRQNRDPRYLWSWNDHTYSDIEYLCYCQSEKTGHTTECMLLKRRKPVMIIDKKTFLWGRSVDDSDLYSSEWVASE